MKIISVKLLAAFTALIMLAACAAGCAAKNNGTDIPLYSAGPDALTTYAPGGETKAPETEAPTTEPLLTFAPTETPTASPTSGLTLPPTAAPTEGPTACPVTEDGKYDTKDEVALYIRLFGHLPSNYITKREANALGWSGGSLEPYAPGCSIGGDYFGNYEGLLPKKQGRKYYECDIGTKGKSSRGAKRIVFSNDGLIYYSDDHYESFTLLYGGD